MKKLSLILLIALSACSQSQYAGENKKAVSRIESAQKIDNNTMDVAGETTAGKVLSNENPLAVQPKLIKRASLVYQTDSIEPEHQQIMQWVNRFQAYISKDKMEQNDYRKSYEMEIRIPVKNFENFVSEIKKHVKQPDYFNINTDDVTEEYVDVQARLKNYNQLKERYLALYKKAKEINEIIDIENYINDIQMKIDRLEGKLKWLDNKTTYSTMNIEIYQNIEQKTIEPERPNRYWTALKNGWSLLNGIFLLILELWPLILLGSGLYFLWKKKIKTKLNQD